MLPFFDRFLHEISESSERIMQVIQEGSSILFESGDIGTSHYSNSGQYDTMNHSPLGDIANNVMDELLKGQVGPQGFLQHFQAFRSAIQWREPFIIGIISFHIIILLVAYFVTKYGATISRLILFTSIAMLVRSAEWVNNKCAQNWSKFASQNYFDPRGIFASIFFSAPLVLISFGMLISYLGEARQLIRELNVQKEQQKRKISKRQTKAAATGTRDTVNIKQD